ncbi:hypothetical protein [Ranavirus maximus]|uniref:Uncharacterized protein n=1 Tax=Ranavirus maximus TaxID=1887314 RepID=A0A1B2IUF9_FRG3V|nr:hypothetical protein BGV90_gp079 [Ranavirus maximus]ANZ57204.1 hypothetical protein [Ranavirus maximus]
MTFFVTVTLPGVVCRMHGELNLSFEQLCEVAFLIEDRRRPSNVTVKVVTVKGLSGSPDSVLVYSNGKYFCRDSDGSETLVVLCSVDNVDLPVVKFVVVPAVGATQQAETAPAVSAPAPAVSAPAPAVTAKAGAFTGFTPFKPTSVFPSFGQVPATAVPAAPAAPAVSAPAVSAPAVSAPAVSAPAPAVSAPAPAVSAPAPAVSAPAVSAPAVSAPAVSAPAVSAPAPAVSAPAPAVSAPAPAVTAKAPAFTGFTPFKPTSVFPSFGQVPATAAPAVSAPAVKAPASLFGPAQPSTPSMFAPSSSLFVPATAPAPSTSGFTIPANLRSAAYVCPFATAEKERKEREQQQPAPKGLNHDLAAQEHLHPSLVSRFPSNFRGSFLG